MAETTHALVRRRDAAQAVLDRHVGRPFEWGVTDCSVLAAAILTELGHAPPVPPARYRSANGARMALKQAGHKSLAAMLDALDLPRIPPAAALPGDLIAMPGHDKLTALGVALGNGRVLGFHEDVDTACVLQPVLFEAAWRVDPRG